MTASDNRHVTIAVVGGGLAGLSAACALADAGFRVTLLERRHYLGGRASSYEHPGTGEVVDNCQHVLLGCCTNLIDFYHRTGVADRIRWFDRLTFLEPGGRASFLEPAPLPAPLHNVPAFLRFGALGLGAKLAIARAMLLLLEVMPQDSSQNFLGWLKDHGQTPQAIERFWKVVLVSALNEDLDRISVYYAAQVFRESFLKSAAAGRMGVPTVPLTELYSAGLVYLGVRGSTVRLRCAVEAVHADPAQVRLAVAGEELAADYAILAVPFDVLGRIVPADESAQRLREQIAPLETSPITGIHLWFDREITELDHAVLLDRTIQWMFHKSRLLGTHRNGSVGHPNGERGSYVELVVSSSKSLVQKSRQEIVDLAMSELYEFLPAARQAQLVKATVIKEIHATFSAQPLVDSFRPSFTTAWPRIFLAGDWTATGWPATMEGAVRSGYRAAEEVARHAGRPVRLLAPDLPPAGFMRLFS